VTPKELELKELDKKYFIPNSKTKIVPFEFWIIIALILGAPGWYFLLKALKNVWF
tara:strand:- start:3790 stop:3954 length:165 start_codon:yes stop_codon:yes gene_type:complete